MKLENCCPERDAWQIRKNLNFHCLHVWQLLEALSSLFKFPADTQRERRQFKLNFKRNAMKKLVCVRFSCHPTKLVDRNVTFRRKAEVLSRSGEWMSSCVDTSRAKKSSSTRRLTALEESLKLFPSTGRFALTCKKSRGVAPSTCRILS